MRLYPQRYPGTGKTKHANTQRHKRKTLPTRTAAKQTRGNPSCYRTTRSSKDEVPVTPLQPRGHTHDADTSGDEDESFTGAGTKRKSKSILRPKGSKFSRKNAARRPSLPAIMGDMEGLDPSTETDNEVCELSPLAAVAARDVAPVSLQEARREASYPYHEPQEPTRLKLVPYDIPSDEPQGPGDLWSCTFENCTRRVHSASSAQGKTHIREHFRYHASQSQEKIDLALSEARPYLPVR